MDWSYWREDIEALQDVYRLVQRRQGYFLAIRLGGQKRRVHLSQLEERYNLPAWKKSYRRRKGLPNFRLLRTHPLLILTNAVSLDDQALLDELDFLARLGYVPEVVDLRQGWVRLDLFEVGSRRLHGVVRSARAAVKAILDELDELGHRYHDPKSLIRRVNVVLRRTHRIYRFTQVSSEFRRIQEHAEMVVLQSLARRDKVSVAMARKRYFGPVSWGDKRTATVVIARRPRRPIKLFSLKLAKTSMRYWAWRKSLQKAAETA